MDFTQRVSIGQRQLSMTRAGFGGAPIGNFPVAVSDESARAALEAAWDAGVRYFDTAPWYGIGLSERRLGAFVRDKPRQEFVISTKVGRVLRPWTTPQYERRYRGASVDPPDFEVRFDYSYGGWCAPGKTACSGSGWRASTCLSSTTSIACTSLTASSTRRTLLSS
jgi:D-threo-aldose 1-dehydrogenase